MLARALARHARRSGPVLFAFGGLGEAWPGMGRGLYAAEPAFRASIDACERAARDHGAVVGPLLHGDGRSTSVDTSFHLRAVHFGILQIALCDSWPHEGVEPDAALSWSLGEAPAA